MKSSSKSTDSQWVSEWVSQSVSQYVLVSSPLWDLQPDINYVWNLLSCLWGTPFFLSILPHFTCHKFSYVYIIYARLLSAQAQYSRSCSIICSLHYNSSLNTWTVIRLSARVRVTLRLTVNQSVCLGVEPTLWTFEQILLPFQEFGSGICCPISVGRPLWREAGSVLCKPQSSHMSVGEVRWGYFTTDGQSVSMSWYRAPLWDLRPDITSCRNFAVWNLRSCFCGVPSLTRG
jgi:hypothetical protein